MDDKKDINSFIFLTTTSARKKNRQKVMMRDFNINNDGCTIQEKDLEIR